MREKIREKFNNWHEFFELLDSVDLNNHTRFNKNLSIPKQLYKLLKEDLNRIEDEEDRHVDMNKFIVILIMRGANIGYNEKTKEFYRLRNGNNLENYYQLKKQPKESKEIGA